MCYVIARINYLFASEIAKHFEILQAITWLADAWKEVNVKTIKNCLAKCGITEQTSEDEDDIVDVEFNILFNKLADLECDMTADKYVNFYVVTCSFLPAINSDKVDWRVSLVKVCVTEYLRKECGDLDEVTSDNDVDKDDDGDVNSKDVEVIEMGTDEALTMLGRFVNLKDLSKEERKSCRHERQIKEALNKRVLNKKQSRINDYFMLEQSLYDRF